MNDTKFDEMFCRKCAEPNTKHHPLDGCPYNGWTNYETWAVKLWMDNEEPSYWYWKEAAQEAYDETGMGISAYARMTGTEIFAREQRASHNLAKQIKGEHEAAARDRLDGESAGVFFDLLSAALSEVNWNEIAESLIGGVEKDEVNADVS